MRGTSCSYPFGIDVTYLVEQLSLWGNPRDIITGLLFILLYVRTDFLSFLSEGALFHRPRFTQKTSHTYNSMAGLLGGGGGKKGGGSGGKLKLPTLFPKSIKTHTPISNRPPIWRPRPRRRHPRNNPQTRWQHRRRRDQTRH